MRELQHLACAVAAAHVRVQQQRERVQTTRRHSREVSAWASAQLDRIHALSAVRGRPDSAHRDTPVPPRPPLPPPAPPQDGHGYPGDPAALDDLEITDGTDGDLRVLVAAQQAEVQVRLGLWFSDGPTGLSARSACLLARLDGTAVGCVALERAAGDVGQITHLYVQPAARGRGLERVLLQGAEDLGVACGYRLLLLQTDRWQPEVLRLEASAGWLRVHDLPDELTCSYRKTIAT